MTNDLMSKLKFSVRKKTTPTISTIITDSEKIFAMCVTEIN